MKYEHTFAGELVQYERPNWDPLIDVVGPHLVRFFMWMSEFEVDGVHAHAYKHGATRRYLHVGEDGRIFRVVDRFRYAVVGRERRSRTPSRAGRPSRPNRTRRPSRSSSGCGGVRHDRVRRCNSW